MLPKNLIIVAGTGRSGTTWLGKLLDSSPQVFYKYQPDTTNRLPWFHHVPSRLDVDPDNDQYRQPFERDLEQSIWTHGLWYYRPPEFPKQFLWKPPWTALTMWLRLVSKLGRGSFPLIRIPRWLIRGDEDNIHVVVKSVVSNMRLAWIHHHFPHIKLVLIVRHPGGYLNSWLTGQRDHGWEGFGTKKRLSSTLLPFACPQHQKYTDLFELGTDFERELIYWIVANESPILQLRGSSRLKLVVYEKLCAEPVTVVEDLCHFLGIQMCQQIRYFVEESVSYHDRGSEAVHKNPQLVSNKWRQQLNADQIACIEKYLADSSIRHFWDSNTPKPLTSSTPPRRKPISDT